MKTKLIFQVLSLFAFAISVAAQTTSIDITAVRDNTLYDSATGSLSNGAGTGVFVGRTGMNAERRGLVAFDVSSMVPAGAFIVSAELRLEVSQAGGGGSINVSCHRLLQDWGEAGSVAGGGGGGGGPAQPGDATWLHRFNPTDFWSAPGAQSGTDYEALAAATSPSPGIGLLALAGDSLRDAAQAMLDTPASDYGFILLSDAASAGQSRRIVSREGNMAQRPVLRLVYAAPLPGTNDDLQMRVGVNGALADVPYIAPAVGDVFSAEITSPGQTLAFVVPVLGGQFFTTPSVLTPPAAAPEIQFDLSLIPGPFAIFDGAQTGGFLPVFIGNGLEFNFGPIPPGLTGAAVRMQVVIATSAALNGFYATSNATSLIFP